MESVASEFGKNRDIDLCRRLDQYAINKLVDVENVAVQRLQGVVVLFEQGAFGRVCWRGGAAGKARGQPQTHGHTKNRTARGGGHSHRTIRELG